MAVIQGTNESNDTLFGTNEDDTIYGLLGDDALFGNEGNDRLIADEGNDIIWGWTGNDTASGGGGNDIIGGDWGNDILNGDAGNDSIFGWEGNDTLLGGLGNDLLMGEQGADLIVAGDGNDIVFGWVENDTINGGNGDDFIGGDQGNDIITGDSGNDVLFGWTGDDHISGGDGNDLLSGEDGNDTLSGGPGQDSLYGGAGDDLISLGSSGSNEHWGEAGNDVYAIFIPAQDVTNLVHDFVQGEDKIDARAIGATGLGIGTNQITTDGANVYVSSKLVLSATNGVTFAASDFIFAPQPPDGITLVSNDSVLEGTSRDDILTAKFETYSNDLLAPVNQRLFGYEGNDTITGGAGSDIISGGSGRDVFVFSPVGERSDVAFNPFLVRFTAADGSEMPNYADVITDFTIGEDVLSIGTLWDLGAPSISNNREVARITSQPFTRDSAQSMLDNATNTTYEGQEAVVLDIYGPDRSTITLVGLTTDDLTLDMFRFG